MRGGRGGQMARSAKRPPPNEVRSWGADMDVRAPAAFSEREFAQQGRADGRGRMTTTNAGAPSAGVRPAPVTGSVEVTPGSAKYADQ